ncbi:hypothetical protein CS8_037290 [Cupriavidus sp. 8B]
MQSSPDTSSQLAMKAWLTRRKRRRFHGAPKRADACFGQTGHDMQSLDARLPNEIALERGQTSLEALATILQMLGRPPCSGSTND